MKSALRYVCLGAMLLAVSAIAEGQSHVSAPASLADSVYTGGSLSVAASPAGVRGTPPGLVQVGIKLSDPPLVVAVGASAKQNGIKMTADQQRAYVVQLNQKQDAVMAQVQAMGGVELGRVTKSHNAVIVSIDGRQVKALRGLSGVIAVRPVGDSTLSLEDASLPYIGATTVQNAGVTGAGIRVAMLDTGIDYTHYNLGGSGNVADYLAAKAVATGTPPPSLFPTGKIVGGFDFTGDVWPNGPLAPDPNPLDLNGHGSHTSDIVGGRSLDGRHVGTAPGTQLYAVKVCSSISTSCSGVAILEGLDFALDPDNTGTLNHPVDVISMSIGGPFGQREDDASETFTDIVNFGVVSVLSAGNDGNIPYIVGEPSSTPEVLSVAATNSASAIGIPLVINSPASIAGTYKNTATLDFAPVNAAVTANVAYIGRGCPAGSISSGSPADSYLDNPAGKIALIDRGSCAISLKIDRAASAGAIGVLVGLVAAGDAVSFSFGGGTNFVPSLVITQSTSNAIKGALAGSPVNATISPANAFSLAGNMASYSSRGPNFSYNMLKPDISAPGTVMAADPGTGNGESAESGTSFSCPLTAGSAALLLSQNRSLTPLDVKAILMETSETQVFNNVATQPGVLAPMSRMGAGEVRVDRAVAGSTAVWDASDPLAVSLSFGTYRLNTNHTYKKKVVIRNYSNLPRTYTIGNVYRDAPNTTGVTLTAPSSISVPPNSGANFTLSLTVNVGLLPAWTPNGGSLGGNGERLNDVEYAGYLTFTSGPESVHLPWHILPHKAANVQPAGTSVGLGDTPQPLTLNNTPAAVGGLVDVFSLTGTGVQFPPSALPAPGGDIAVTNLKAAGLRLVCLDNACASLGVQFAITTFGQRSHPDVPAEFDIDIDLNHDGNPDLIAFNADIGYATTGTFTGQNGWFVYDVAAGTVTGPISFSIADLDSANMIATLPLVNLKTKSGMQMSAFAPFQFSVLAFDNYFTGFLTDIIGPMTYELDMPQFYPDFDEPTVPRGGSFTIQVIPNNAANVYFTGPYNGNSPSQTGLLLLYKDGLTGQEASLIDVSQGVAQ